ncbi:hypothetical protein [Anaerofustis stercorihominis]|uniref:Lipoprotein n=1 Tax=Anaerofustis stercorihominis TaxID=214853 RepID=A0A3E3E1W5_9FIRM|nr:hypothetical protein [Anaerofustis stercorihominis]RGD75537.1 hypothetical protein DW687_04210 [Anaerofustis stercorihominis]
MKRFLSSMLLIMLSCVFFYSCSYANKSEPIGEYSDVLKSSQKMEVIDRTNGNVIKVIKDKKRITAFVDNLHIDKWKVSDKSDYNHNKKESFEKKYCYEYILSNKKDSSSFAVYKDKSVVRFKSIGARYDFAVPDNVASYMRNADDI